MAPPRRFDWARAKELADKGVWMSKAAKLLGCHHTTALHIGRQMGFRWPRVPREIRAEVAARNRHFSKHAVVHKKPVVRESARIVRDTRVDRMMELAERIHA